MNLEPGKYKLVDWYIENPSGDWCAGEIGDNLGVDTNIDRNTYSKSIIVKPKIITIANDIDVEFNIPVRDCKKNECYFEYENVYLSKPNDDQVVEHFKNQAKDNYSTWRPFKWKLSN